MRPIQHPSLTRRGALLFGGVTAIGFPLLLLLIWVNLKVNSMALTLALFSLILLLKTAGPLAQSWVSGYRAERQVLEVGSLSTAALRASELPGFIAAQPSRLSAAQIQALAGLFEVPAVRQ
jgi:hypothetical protein